MSNNDNDSLLGFLKKKSLFSNSPNKSNRRRSRSRSRGSRDLDSRSNNAPEQPSPPRYEEAPRGFQEPVSKLYQDPASSKFYNEPPAKFYQEPPPKMYEEAHRASVPDNFGRSVDFPPPEAKSHYAPAPV